MKTISYTHTRKNVWTYLSAFKRYLSNCDMPNTIPGILNCLTFILGILNRHGLLNKTEQGIKYGLVSMKGGFLCFYTCLKEQRKCQTLKTIQTISKENKIFRSKFMPLILICDVSP